MMLTLLSCVPKLASTYSVNAPLVPPAPLYSASSMRAVKSMPVGPVVAFPDSGADASNEEGGPLPLSLTASLSPIDREAPEATSGSPSSATAAEEGGDAEVGGGDRGVVGMVARVRGSRMTAKERSRSVALSPGCRRCLNCETLYDLVRGVRRFTLRCYRFLYPAAPTIVRYRGPHMQAF